MNKNKAKSNNKTPDKNIFSEWLEKLQQESWQLELLISGLALYGIFEAKSLLIDISVYRSHTEGALWNVTNLLLGLLYVGRIIFLINLLAHIMIRGLWIGAIGLRYVSGDIDYDALHYSKRFTRYLKKRIGTYDDFIEKLEKICSVIFAYTFLLFLLFLSFVVFMGVIMVLINLMSSVYPFEDYKTYYKIIGFSYYGLGLIVLIDFISLGLFKKIKNKTISKIYFYIYKFVSIVSLSFLYRPLLYNFLDEKFTRRLFFFSIPYIFLVAYGKNLFNNELYTYTENITEYEKSGLIVPNNYYQDLRDKALLYKNKYDKKWLNSSIPKIVLNAYYMETSFPSVFIKIETSDRNLLKKNKALSPIYKEGVKFTFPNGQSPRVEIDSIMRQRIDSLYRVNNYKKDTLFVVKPGQDSLSIEEKNYKNIMDSFMDLIDIKIDNINYNDSLECKYGKYPSSGDIGFLCHFNSKSLSVGYHELSFKKRIYLKQKKKDSVFSVKLPFIKVE